jgi:hypothetical protein
MIKYEIKYDKTWEEQKRMITDKVIPAIRKQLGSRYRYNDSDACQIIQNLHWSRHRVANIQQDKERAKKDARRKKTNSKRADVRKGTLLYHLLYYSLINWI